MRIAMISEHASPLAALGGEDAGGQNTHVAEVATALARQGHEIHVYTRRDSPDLADAVPVRDGVTVVHVPAGPPEPIGKDSLLPYMDGFGEWLTERWLLGDWLPDVVHAHFWMSGIAGLIAGHRLGLPVVQTYHALGTVKRRYQGAADTSPPRRIALERRIGCSVDRVVAQCRDEVRELLRLGVPQAKLAIIPSGVDSDTFSPDGPAAPRDLDRPRILSVGRFVPRKGFDDVIRALRRVPAAECVIIGGPPAAQLAGDPLAAQLLEVARSHGVADRVRLVGAVPPSDMPQWYRSADVVATTPWYEPFGLVPLEAMACGVPVVATAVGGLTDTVVAGLTGDLVPAKDPAALGMVVRRLLDDPARRSAYGAAARERARRCYAWRRTANQLSALYTEVTAARPVSEVAA
jgi:glycosyltransferase involved in cell wall biosynthesis